MVMMTDSPVQMEWLMETRLDPDADISLARMTVKAGALSELHHHTNCSETIHIVAGQINQRMGDEWRVMNVGDTCLIRSGEIHQTKNTGDENAVMMIVYSAGQRVYVKD